MVDLSMEDSQKYMTIHKFQTEKKSNQKKLNLDNNKRYSR